MATTFKPAINIKDILASVKPEAKKVAKAKTEKGEGAGSSASNLSGFPTIQGLHEFVFATNPNVARNQMAAIMDLEYPFGFCDKTGKVVAADVRGAIKARLDKEGKIMMGATGPVTRAYKPAHFAYYKKGILGKGKWTIGEDFGVTDVMKEAAVKAYDAEMKAKEVAEEPAK